MHIRHKFNEDSNCVECGKHKHHKHNTLKDIKLSECKGKNWRTVEYCCLCGWEKIK